MARSGHRFRMIIPQPDNDSGTLPGICPTYSHYGSIGEDERTINRLQPHYQSIIKGRLTESRFMNKGRLTEDRFMNKGRLTDD